MVNYTDLIGVPFLNQGRDIKQGFDCYGLVMEVYKRFGYNIPEYTADFDDTEKINALISGKTKITSHWKKADASDLPVPCLIAMRYGVPKGIVNHTAVYIGEGKFIHTREHIGVCVDRVDSLAWRNMIEDFYEYVGEKNG